MFLDIFICFWGRCWYIAVFRRAGGARGSVLQSGTKRRLIWLLWNFIVVAVPAAVIILVILFTTIYNNNDRERFQGVVFTLITWLDRNIYSVFYFHFQLWYYPFQNNFFLHLKAVDLTYHPYRYSVWHSTLRWLQNPIFILGKIIKRFLKNLVLLY